MKNYDKGGSQTLFYEPSAVRKRAVKGGQVSSSLTLILGDVSHDKCDVSHDKGVVSHDKGDVHDGHVDDSSTNVFDDNGEVDGDNG